MSNVSTATNRIQTQPVPAVMPSTRNVPGNTVNPQPTANRTDSNMSLTLAANTRAGINSGDQSRFTLNAAANQTLIAQARNLPPTAADREVGNVGDITGYGATSIPVRQNGRTTNVPIDDIVRTAANPRNQIFTGPQHAKINGANFYLDYHGSTPVRMSYQSGNRTVSGVIVNDGRNNRFVEDSPLRTLGVQTQITNSASRPWRELGIPDWRQSQLQGIANNYMQREIPTAPGRDSITRRTNLNNTDTNVAFGNGENQLPVLNYRDVGNIFAAIAKDQRLTDNEKFEVSRLISAGYGRRVDGLGAPTNELADRRYQLSSQFSLPINADSGVHRTFPLGGRFNHHRDHGTHILNGANYSDNRHAGWIQRDLNNGLDNNTILNNFRNRATREETAPGGRVNVGDVESSVNATASLLAGFRQSQASNGRSGYAQFAIDWINRSVSPREAQQIINDFRLRDELRR